MSQPAAIDMQSSMRKNGRSFWFASRFLSRQTATDANVLYAFCRTMDDLADKSTGPEAVGRLHQVRMDLERGNSTDPCVAMFLQLARRHHLPLPVADHLIQSFVCDAQTKLRLATERDLIRYCFGVAGTVGLMMSPVLGATNKEARRPAIDLGIAMQMTNIARDVLEDARDGRRYLPGAWLADLPPEAIATELDCREAVRLAIDRLLCLADDFYANARDGFAFIPIPNRTAIEVAAAVYREIGVSLRKRNLQWWSGRTTVSMPRKIVLAASVLAGRSPLHRLRSSLPQRMHQALAGLPGTA